jgi:hypothetical protein
MKIEDILKAIKPYVLGWVSSSGGGAGYVHPNHSGDVTSVGDGAQTIANKVTMTATAPMAVSGAPTVIAGGAVAISVAAASTSSSGVAPQATAPASGLYNYVGITNGETAYANKALFDATVPTTIAPSDAASAGTATVAARRDHLHAAPASFPATAHAMFSASHSDIAANAAPVDGDVIIGNVTPKWSKLAISIPAASLINVLGVVNGELRPSWKALLDATNPAAVGTAAPGTATTAAHRDHVHAMGNLTGDVTSSALATTIGAGKVTPAMLAVASAQYKFLVAGSTPFAYAESAGGLNVASGKIPVFSKSITFDGTDATTMTFPSTSQSIPGLGLANTWLTGQIVGNGTGNAGFILDGAAGGLRQLIFRSGGVGRWNIIANATAEGGSDAGTDLQFVASSDAGAAIYTPIFIKRSTGKVRIGSNTAADYQLDVTGDFRCSAGASITMSASNSKLAIGSTPPTSATVGTGIWIDSTGMYGLNANVLQAFFSAVDGSFQAVDGGIVLNAAGFLVRSHGESDNFVKWTNGDITTYTTGFAYTNLQKTNPDSATTGVFNVGYYMDASNQSGISFWKNSASVIIQNAGTWTYALDCYPDRVALPGSMALKDGITAPSALSGYAKIYVDGTSGDLKVIFGDGVTKTIVVDT